MVVMPVFELVKKLPGMTSAAIPAWIVPPRCGVSLLPEAWDWLTADSQPAAPNRDAPTPRAAKPWSRVRRLTAPDRGRVGVDMDRPFEGLRAGCRPGHGHELARDPDPAGDISTAEPGEVVRSGGGPRSLPRDPPGTGTQD